MDPRRREFGHGEPWAFLFFSTLLFNDNPTVKRLYRAVVAMLQRLLEYVQLFAGQRHRFFHHQPAQSFAAGRGGQGTAKAIIVAIGWEQRRQVESFSTGTTWFSCAGMLSIMGFSAVFSFPTVNITAITAILPCLSVCTKCASSG